MRRTLVLAGGLLGAVPLVLAAPWRAAAVPTLLTHTAVCSVTSYTVSGDFTVVGGPASFTVHASGGCVGTSGSVNVDLAFKSIGSWGCDDGVATGSGAVAPNNASTQLVNASLVNVGGEYVIELHNPSSAGAGQFTTLPVECDLGHTQTTVAGTGTLTFSV